MTDLQLIRDDPPSPPPVVGVYYVYEKTVQYYWKVDLATKKLTLSARELQDSGSLQKEDRFKKKILAVFSRKYALDLIKGLQAVVKHHQEGGTPIFCSLSYIGYGGITHRDEEHNPGRFIWTLRGPYLHGHSREKPKHAPIFLPLDIADQVLETINTCLIQGNTTEAMSY